MRNPTVVVVLFGLVGCQATIMPELSDNEISPLTTSIEIGAFPISRAAVDYETELHFREDAQSATIDFRYRSRLSVTHEGQDTIFDETITSVDVGGHGLHPRAYTEAEQEFANLIGVRIVARIGEGNSEPKVEITEGQLSAELLESAKDWGNLRQRSLMSGKTLQQGQELFNLEARDFFGQNSSDTDLVGQISARVIGQAIYDKRPVIVAKLVGLIGDGTVEAPLDGLFYLDIFTGINIYTRGHIALTGPAGESFEMTMVSHLDLNQPGQIQKEGAKAISAQDSVSPAESGGKIERIRMFCFVGEGGRRLSIYVENKNFEDRSCSASCPYTDNRQEGVLTCTGTVPARSTRAILCTKYGRGSKYTLAGDETIQCK